MLWTPDKLRIMFVKVHILALDWLCLLSQCLCCEVQTLMEINALDILYIFPNPYWRRLADFLRLSWESIIASRNLMKFYWPINQISFAFFFDSLWESFKTFSKHRVLSASSYGQILDCLLSKVFQFMSSKTDMIKIGRLCSLRTILTFALSLSIPLRSMICK